MGKCISSMGLLSHANGKGEIKLFLKRVNRQIAIKTIIITRNKIVKRSMDERWKNEYYLSRVATHASPLTWSHNKSRRDWTKRNNKWAYKTALSKNLFSYMTPLPPRTRKEGNWCDRSSSVLVLGSTIHTATEHFGAHFFSKVCCNKIMHITGKRKSR